MTPDQIKKVDALMDVLSKLTKNEQRFVAYRDDNEPLSKQQAAYLDDLYKRYVTEA
jgi:hypothetical protein